MPCRGILPGELKTIVAHCLAHGRRQFVEVAERFPEECRHVLESLGGDLSQRRGRPRAKSVAVGASALSSSRERPDDGGTSRLACRQFDERLVEPNSSLGRAISYLLKHWERLTLFLRVPGAPLDNNICERALKTAILHRKNALFYKTCHGAHVGDVFMSLIHTCELCGANPFDYLTELERHADELSSQPATGCPGTTGKRSPKPPPRPAACC